MIDHTDRLRTRLDTLKGRYERSVVRAIRAMLRDMELAPRGRRRKRKKKKH